MEAGELILQRQSPAGQVNPNPVDVLTPRLGGVSAEAFRLCVEGLLVSL